MMLHHEGPGCVHGWMHDAHLECEPLPGFLKRAQVQWAKRRMRRSIQKLIKATNHFSSSANHTAEIVHKLKTALEELDDDAPVC